MAEALGVAGSIVGVVSLGIQVAQGLLDYYGAWKDQDKEISNMCTSLENLLGVLVMIRTTIESFGKFDMSVREIVEKNIRTIEQGINELSDELKHALGLGVPKKDLMRSRIRKALYPFKQPTLSKIEQAISQARANLAISLQTLQLKSILEAHQNIDKLVRLQEDSENRKILDWLSSKNFRLVQNDVYGQKQPDTGQWLLEHPKFLAWEEGKIDTPLWCVGSPGVGKTVLSSAVVRFLEQDLTMQEVGVAFVYCDHTSNDVQQHEYFICAIIRQLIERKQTMPEYAQMLYKNHITTQSRPTSDEYLSLLQSLSKEHSEVYILIDALDECINKDREMIWNKLLIDLKENVQNLRLLCTSRDMDSTGTALSESTCIEIRASDEDMRAYIQAQIQSSHSLVGICRRDTSLENEILQVVVAKAEGMFLAAKLHVNSLASQKHARAVRKALDTLPKDIDDIYDRTMERVQLHRQRDLAMQTLTWIVYATRPLAIEEVQQAIAIDDLDPDDAYITEDLLTPPDVIASVCAGLIKVDRESSVIRLVHKTTHEYFDRKGAEHFPGAKLHIGMSCLNYLSLALIEKDPNAGFENLWIRYQLKLFEYVAENLAHHVRGETDRRLLDLASQILMHPRIEYGYLSTRIVSSFYMAKLRNWDAPGGFCGRHFAALLGLESIIKHFMEDSTINIDLKDGDGRTPLWYASANGEYIVVKLLLEIDKIDINSKERYGCTPLGIAASEGHEEVVRLLLDMDNIDINSRDEEGKTPLRAAAEEGREGVVKLLLEMDDVDNYSLDGNFRTALEAAAIAGHEGVVKLLLESRAKSSDINSALIMAADNKHEPVVELLLEKGADINASTSQGERALMSAARRGHEPVVRLLLEKGADINSMTEKGKTALMLAARRGHESVVKLLLDNGADINLTSEGETALILAACEGHGDVVKLLLEKGGDINSMTRTDQGNNALILAVVKGYEDIVKLLLERGADIDVMTEKGETVLTLAAAEGHEDVVKLLLEKGIADINTRAVFGFKALIMAIHQGHEAVVKLLLLEKSVADLNEMADHGNVALSLAAEKGHEAIIKLLLEQGKADQHEG